MEIIRFNAGDLRADRLEAVLTWVRSLGIEPNNVAARAAIVPAEKGWQLHLSRFIRDDQGRIRLDMARDDVVTEPLVVDLGPERTWPDLGPEAESSSVVVRLKTPDPATAAAIHRAMRNAERETRRRFG